LTKVAASLWKTSSRIETWDRDIAYTQKWVLVEIIQSLGVTEGAVSRVKGHTGRPLRPTHTHTQQRIWSTKTWRTSRQWGTTWPRHQSKQRPRQQDHEDQEDQPAHLHREDRERRSAQESSAPAGGGVVFAVGNKVLHDLLGDFQMSSLADCMYIQAALMLNYNEREIG
jgi:hypothetical protein